MHWSQVTSEIELRTLGSFQVVKNQVEYDVEPYFKIRCRSWKDLYEQVKNLQELSHLLLENEMNELQQLRIEKSKVEKKVKPEYFLSYEDAYIFYLLELEGNSRFKKLNMTRALYHNREKATIWYQNICSIIHPSICHHPKAESAMIVLNDIYKKMIDEQNVKYN
ncbi:MAG TPA: hypothetical protein DCY20_09150 [Firmicutes bacterium]|nr:hypothetical protein [Bacillota bacterium]